MIGCRGWTICGSVCVVLIVGLSVLLASLKRLDSTQYGVKYHVHKKQLDDLVSVGGLHSGTPGFQFITFPSTQITMDEEGTCLSRDGLRVGFEVSFQYQIPKLWVPSAIIKYRDFANWATIVRAAGQSAVQHSCSLFEISNFQSERGVIQTTMEDLLHLKLKGPGGDGVSGLYARAISFQLRNVKLPVEYNDAIAAKQAAEEDIGLAIAQRNQEVTKARTKLLAANEQARKILDTARNEANVTLTEANLRAEEIKFALEKEASVLFEVKQALNLTTTGMLSYQANQMYGKASNLHVSSQEPASMSYIDDL
jgi:regulator of protease activity HflC (stomatin/prohibitin superfamily)